MSYFMYISCKNPKRDENEHFGKDFTLYNMSGTPTGNLVTNMSSSRISYVITKCMDSQALIDQGPKNDRCAITFLECIKEACMFSESVSVMLYFSHGNIFNEKVSIKLKHKIEIDEFTNLFPRIEENVLYIIYSNTVARKKNTCRHNKKYLH